MEELIHDTDELISRQVGDANTQCVPCTRETVCTQKQLTMDMIQH